MPEPDRSAPFLSSHPGFARMAMLVAVVALVLHAPSALYGFTYLDDDQLVLQRAAFLTEPLSLLRAFSEPYFGPGSSSYYRPLVTASFVLDGLFGGVSPLGYHLTNVGLHVVTSVIVLALLLELGVGALPARIGALGFAVHPLQVASVAWIPGRNDVLLAGFVLMASLFLLLARREARSSWKVGHGACFAAALFCKETALVAPLWFAALAMATETTTLFKQRWLWWSWGLGLAAYAVARSLALSGTPAGPSPFAGFTAQHALLPLAELGKLLVPARLQVLSAPSDVAVWPGLIAALLLVAVFVGVVGARRRILLLALAWLAIPVLAGLLGARALTLESRLYLAVAGVALLGAEVLRALGAGERARPMLSVVPAALLVALAIATVRHAPNYAHADRFARAAIAASPNSGVAVNLVQRAAMRNAR